ncbi:MAG: hypothetical protein AAF637_16235, partial [Pseudomonadota bacterium]
VAMTLATRLLVPALIVASGLGVTFALAEEDKPTLTREEMRMIDADKDGEISEQEFLRRRADAAAWSAMDLDRDGSLDAEEQRGALRPAPIVRTR